MTFKIFLILSILMHLFFLYFSSPKNELSMLRPQVIGIMSLPVKDTSVVDSNSLKSAQSQVVHKDEVPLVKQMPVSKLLNMELSYPLRALKEKLEAEIPIEIKVESKKLISYKILSNGENVIFNLALEKSLNEATIKDDIPDGIYQVKIIYKLKN